MPWFKVDDTLHSHPKGRTAGLAAMGLWSICGSYAMAYKTGGFVPDWFVAGFKDGRKLAAVLVRVGLWENAIRDGEPGYQFHDWDHYQPSVDEIERDREASRERQRRFREKRREAKESGLKSVSRNGVSHALVTPLVTRESRGCNAVSHGTPSRPVPTRPTNYNYSPSVRQSPNRVVTFQTRSKTSNLFVTKVTREPSDKGQAA